MGKKRWMVLLLALLVLLPQGGCKTGFKGDEGKKDPPPKTAAAPLPTLRTGVTILADGVVQAVQPPLPLAFASGGTLQAIHVRVGDLLKAGDAIATLDDTLAQDTVAQAQLNLQRAELALEDLKRSPEELALATAQASLAAANADLAALTIPASDQQLEAARQDLGGAEKALADLLDQPEETAVAIARQQVEQAKNGRWGAQSRRDAVCGQAGGGMFDTECDGANASVQQSEAGVRIAELQLEQLLLGPDEGRVAAGRAQVAQAQVELDTLQRGPDPARVKASEAAVRQAQAALDALLAGASAHDLATAEISVSLTRLELETAQRAVVHTELVAPTSGTVLSIEVAPGALVGAGSPIVTLLDTSRLELHTTNLSERDVRLVLPGQSAVVTLKAYADVPIRATVVRVGVEAGPAVGDAATFPVILALAETGLDIRPGMTGRAEIHGED